MSEVRREAEVCEVVSVSRGDLSGESGQLQTLLRVDE